MPVLPILTVGGESLYSGMEQKKNDMTLNFFNTPPKPNFKRTDALNTVRVWLKARPYLPRDFRLALLTLLPELRDKDEDDIEYDSPPEE